MYDNAVVGDVVKVLVDRADGCSPDVHVKGNIGVVTKINFNGVYVYDGGIEYVYGSDQLKKATDAEIKKGFVKYVMRHYE